MTGFTALPPWAAWRHQDAREGFEVARFEGLALEGHTTAVEDGEPWAVRYAIVLDAVGRTRSAHVHGLARAGAFVRMIEGDGAGHWRVDGSARPELDGCLDVDLESSSLTNAFPVRRLALAIGAQAEAPAVYVRALDLSVMRLEQHYRRLEDDGDVLRFDYRSPAFDFACVLRSDASGLALDYPGIAMRVR
jgi:uncharacterized protein